MSDSKRQKLPHTHLAEGEVTGHYHEALGQDVAFYDDGLLEAPQGATVTHQEHHTVTLPPGNYNVGRVKEYDPFMEEARKVAD